MKKDKKTKLQRVMPAILGMGVATQLTPALLLDPDIRRTVFGGKIKGVPPISDDVINNFKKIHKIEDVPVHTITMGIPRFIPKGFGAGNEWGVHIKKDNIATTLHELGHASNYRRFPKTNTIVGIMSKVLPPLVGAGMLTSDKTDQYAAPTAALLLAPNLVEEARASRKAYKYIKAFDPKSVKPSVRVLAKAFGTYGLAALGTVGALYGGYKLNNKEDKK